MRDPQIDRIIQQAKERKFKQQATDGAQEVIRTESKGLLAMISNELANALKPAFDGLAKDLIQTVQDSFKNVKVDVPKSDAPQVSVNVPDIYIPDIKVPEPKVTVNVPRAERPQVTVQPTPVTFPSEMSLKAGNRPFPVIMMDRAGKPMEFPQGSMGASGGRSDFFTIKDIQTSTGASIISDSENAVRVTGGVSVTGATGSLAAALVDSSGIQYSGSNPLPVTTTVSGITNSIATSIIDSTGIPFEGANPFPVYIASGTGASTAVVVLDRDGNPQTQPTIAQGDAATAQRVVIAGNSDASVVVNSGTITTVTTLTGITNSIQSALVDSTGVQYSGSNPVPITGNIGTVTTLTGITNSIQAVILDRDGNPQTQPVIAQGDAATALRVVIAGNSDASVVVNSGTITTVTTLTGVTNSIQVVALDRDGNPLTTGPIGAGEQATALRILQAGDSVSSVVVNSGTITTVTTLTGVTNSIQVVQLDRDGNPLQSNVFGPGEQANSLRVLVAGDSAASVVVNSGTITTVTTLTGITNSIATVLTDSSGIQYSGSNPVPTTATLSVAKDQGDAASAMRVVVAGNSDASVVVNSGTITTVTTLTGITNTVNVRLDTPDGIVSAANPLQVTLAAGGLDSMFLYQARTTLPTAVADGADVRPKADKLGRSITRPIQVRDLISTARVNVVNGTETTLLAAVSGNFMDMISVIAANASTNAVTADFRDVSGAGIAFSLTVPANATNGIVHAVPYPQQETNSRWTVDLTDDTHNITFSALFSKES